MRQQGYAAELCQGAEVAERVILDYLNGDYVPVYIIPPQKGETKNEEETQCQAQAPQPTGIGAAL